MISFLIRPARDGLLTVACGGDDSDGGGSSVLSVTTPRCRPSPPLRPSSRPRPRARPSSAAASATARRPIPPSTTRSWLAVGQHERHALWTEPSTTYHVRAYVQTSAGGEVFRRCVLHHQCRHGRRGGADGRSRGPEARQRPRPQRRLGAVHEQLLHLRLAPCGCRSTNMMSWVRRSPLPGQRPPAPMQPTLWRSPPRR